jgi:hypothetical protein
MHGIYTDKQFRKTLETTKNKQYPHQDLWDFVYYVFDMGAKSEGILGGLEHAYHTVEDFCAAQNITTFPPLCKYIFSFRGSFLTQSKLSYYHQEMWNAAFPESFCCRDLPSDILNDYHLYLIDKSEKYALVFMNKYYHQNPSPSII